MHSVCRPQKKMKWKKQDGKASLLINARDTQTRTHSISKYRMVH